MTPIHTRARALLAHPFLADQPVDVARRASELRHALHEPLTDDTTRRLLSVLADLDMTRAESMRGERDAVAREIVRADASDERAKIARWGGYVYPRHPGPGIVEVKIVGRMPRPGEAVMQRTDGTFGAPAPAALSAYPAFNPSAHEDGWCVEVKVGQRWRGLGGAEGTVIGDAGPGWRWLAIGETVEAGDELYGHGGGIAVDYHVGRDAGVEHSIRRRVTPAVDILGNAPDPGYRLLAVGEQVQPGDEMIDPDTDEWRPVHADYCATLTHEWRGMARRRVEGPQVGETWREVPTGVVVRVLAVGPSKIKARRESGVGRYDFARTEIDKGRFERVEAGAGGRP